MIGRNIPIPTLAGCHTSKKSILPDLIPPATQDQLRISQGFSLLVLPREEQ